MEKWSQQQIDVYKRSVEKGTQEIEEYESSIVFHQNKIKGIHNKLERTAYKKTRELSQLFEQGWILTDDGWKEREIVQNDVTQEDIKRVQAILDRSEDLCEEHAEDKEWLISKFKKAASKC